MVHQSALTVAHIFFCFFSEHLWKCTATHKIINYLIKFDRHLRCICFILSAFSCIQNRCFLLGWMSQLLWIFSTRNSHMLQFRVLFTSFFLVFEERQKRHDVHFEITMQLDLSLFLVNFILYCWGKKLTFHLRNICDTLLRMGHWREKLN